MWAAWKQKQVVTIVLVFLMYPLSARTGHHFLSSGIDDTFPIADRNISSGENEAVWFFAEKDGSGSILTPS